jgi:hypothetical protein
MRLKSQVVTCSHPIRTTIATSTKNRRAIMRQVEEGSAKEMAAADCAAANRPGGAFVDYWMLLENFDGPTSSLLRWPST